MLTLLYSWVLQRRYTASLILTALTTPALRTSSSQMVITNSANSNSSSIASASASSDLVQNNLQNGHQTSEYLRNSFNSSSQSIIHDDSAYDLNNSSELKINISSQPHQPLDIPSSINPVNDTYNVFESSLYISNSSFFTSNNTLISTCNNNNMQQPILVQVLCSPVFMSVTTAIMTIFQEIILSLQPLEPHINSFADNPISFVISGYKTAYSNKNVRIIFAAIMYLICFHSLVRVFCFVNAKVNDYFMYLLFDDLKYQTDSTGINRNITEPYAIMDRDGIQETRLLLKNESKEFPENSELDQEAKEDILASLQYMLGDDTDKTSESESGYESEPEPERENILGLLQLFSSGDSNKSFIFNEKGAPYITDHPRQNISENEHKPDCIFEHGKKVNSFDFGSQSLIKCEASTDDELTESTFLKYALRPYIPALIQLGEDESNLLNMNQSNNNLDPISELGGPDTVNNDTNSFSLPQSESTHLAGGFNDINLSIDLNSRSLNLRPSEIVFNCLKDTCQSNYPSSPFANNTRAQSGNVKTKKNSLKEKLGPAASEIKKILMATPEDLVDRLLESPLETGGAILLDYALSHLMKIQPKIEKQASESLDLERLSPLKHPDNNQTIKKSPLLQDLFNVSSLPALTAGTTASLEHTNCGPESNFKTLSLIINISPTKSIPRLESSSRPPSRLLSRLANRASSSELLQQTPKTPQRNLVGANLDLEDVQNRSSSRTSSSDSKTFNSVASITSKTLNAKPRRFSSPRKNLSVGSGVKHVYYDLPQQIENLFNVSSYTNEQYLKEAYNVDHEDHSLAYLAQGNEKWLTECVSGVEIDSLFSEFSGKETAENWKKRSENADAVVVFLQREDLGADIRQAIRKNFLKHLDDLLEMVKTKRSTLTKKAIYLLRDLVVYGDFEDILDIVLPKSVLALLNLSFASSARSRFLKDLSLRTACDIIMTADLQQFLKLQGAIFKPATEKININSKVFYHWSLEVYKAYILCHRTELTENYAATISEEAQKHSLETTLSRMCNDFTELMMSAQKNTLLHKIITKSLSFFSSLNKVISGHVQSRKAMVEIFLVVQRMAPILEPLNVIYLDVFDKATQAKIKRENLDPSLFLLPYLTLPSGGSDGDFAESSDVQLDPSNSFPSLGAVESSKAKPAEAKFLVKNSFVENKPQDSKLVENDDLKNTTLFRPLGSSGNKSNNFLALSKKSFEAGKENEEPAAQNLIPS